MLPPSFAGSYVSALRALSKKEAGSEEAQRALGMLKSLNRELFVRKRGELWIPEPNKIGRYPIMDNPPYQSIRTAIRDNTSQAVRDQAWKAVAKAAEPFIPGASPQGNSTMDLIQKRHLLAAAVVGLPVTKGRTPALLGKVVPGELKMGSSLSRSIFPVSSLSPEDQARGFTSMKFASNQLFPQKGKSMGVQYYGGFSSRHASGWGAGKIRNAIKGKPEKIIQHHLTPEESICYEEGFRDSWRRFKEIVLGQALPITLRHGSAGALGALHQEFGSLPSTEIDSIPLTLKSFKSEFSGYPNATLNQLRHGLRRSLSQTPDPISRRALEKRIGELEVELMSRKEVF
jgi:hypothetical protein